VSGSNLTNWLSTNASGSSFDTALRNELQALPGIGAGNVTVSHNDTYDSNGALSRVVLVTFGNALIGVDVPLMKVEVRNGASFTGAGVVQSSPLFGQSVTLTATVTVNSPGSGATVAPQGAVIFKIDGVDQPPVNVTRLGTSQNFVASLTFTPTSVKTYSIQASYSGDGNFNGSSSSPSSLGVSKAGSTTTVAANPTSTLFGMLASFFANVSAMAPGSGTPSGSVTFYDGAITSSKQIGAPQPLGNGVASISTSSLSVGTHTILASYSGDSSFFAGTSIVGLVYVVGQASTSTTLGSSGNPSSYGQTVVYTATVTSPSAFASLGGTTVTFFVDGSQRGSPVPLSVDAGNPRIGTATLALKDLTPGQHSIQVTYQGSTQFAPGSSNVVFQGVNRASTVTTLASSTPVAGSGVPMTLTAHISPIAPAGGVPGGSVTFFVDNVARGTVSVDSSGNARFTLPIYGVRNHAVFARYNGDGNYNGSARSMVQAVRFPTKTIITASPGFTVQGQAATFTASVLVGRRAVTAGAVTFVVDGRALRPLSLIRGRRSLRINWLGAGQHTISAVYAGSVALKLAVSSASTTYQVKPFSSNPAVGLTAVALPAGTGTFFPIRVYALDSNGAVTSAYSGPLSFQVLSKPPGALLAGSPSSMSGGQGTLMVEGTKIGTYTVLIRTPDFSIATSFRIATA